MKEEVEEVKYAVELLGNALDRLKEGISQAKDELDKDGVIQRFEFTFELFWKSLKIFLGYQGIEVKTPRESLKEAFRINLIDDEETFLKMLIDRNITSHIYGKEISEEVFERIKTSYIQSIENVFSKLKSIVEGLNETNNEEEKNENT